MERQAMDQRGYLPGIDGLRAVAVLAVVAYHAGLPVPAGFVGVDVFFVISGYVITRMLAREHAETGRIDFAAFYARRVRRILPAFAVVVAITLALSTVLLVPEYRVAVAKSAAAAMAMGANVYFQLTTGGYFDSSSDQMPLLHLWSLAVEEQFYFVWPLLLALLLRLRRGPWVLAALGVASFALAQGLPDHVAFYHMPARFWELAAGGLLALLPARSSRLAAPAGLVLLVLAAAVPLDHFPGSGAVPAVLGAALVLHAIHGGLRVPVLELRPVRYVGLISYSLYLWHWPLLALHRASSLDAPTLGENLLLCGVAVALAALSYRFVETPLRASRVPKVKALAVGVATCCALALFAGGVGAMSRGDDLASRTARDFDTSPACHSDKDAPATLPPAACGTGDVVLWGDSHAHAWRGYADRFGAVTPLTRSGCAPSAGDIHGTPCDQFNAIALQRAERARVVVLSAFWLQDFGNAPAKRKTTDGMAAVLAALAPRVQRIVVMGALPVMRYSPQKCLQDRRVSECAMPRAKFDSAAAEPMAFLRHQATLYHNVEIVDPASFFCTPTACPLMRDGYSLYWDDDHISSTAARRFN